MMNYVKNLKYSKNNIVYVEEDVINEEYTKEILKKLKNHKIIKVKHYKDIFNRKNQSHLYQKDNLKIILAKSNEKKLYEGSEICNNFGFDNFYYTVSSMNCIYDCQYCFLKGMYPSSYIVIFVDYKKIMNEVKEKVEEKAYISLSYEGDLLALENLHGLNRKWINFARDNPSIYFESRTKSSNFKDIRDINPIDNYILSWSLSPQTIIDMYEKHTPDLDSRIDNIKEAIKRGWKVRIFIEPVLRVQNGVNIYREMFEYLKKEINIDDLDDINFDFFRINRDYFKRLKNIYKDSILFAYPFEDNQGILEYKDDFKNKINEEFKKIFVD